MELTVEKLPNIYDKTLGFDTQIYPQAQKKKDGSFYLKCKSHQR